MTETSRKLETEMLAAAENLEFEKGALLRGQINELKRGMGGGEESARKVSYKRGGKRRGRR